MSISEERLPGPIHDQTDTMTLPPPDTFELMEALRAGFLDSGLCLEWQEAFGGATNFSNVSDLLHGPSVLDRIRAQHPPHDRTPVAFNPDEGERSGPGRTKAEELLAEELARQVARVVEGTAVNLALREADRLKDEFFAVVGHELRNPLAAISNALQLVCLKSRGDPDLGSATAVLERQVQQLIRLVDDLVDVSRVRQGKLQLVREMLDLRIVMTRAIESCRPRIDARRHHLEVSLPERPIEVEGDLTRLAQVVSNLLCNSAKYTPNGGRIEISLDAEEDQAILRIRDTGVGIDPALLPSIFDLFTQVQGTENRSEGGLGIGLSLVRNIVDLHGGLRASPERGARPRQRIRRSTTAGNGGASLGSGHPRQVRRHPRGAVSARPDHR